MNTPSDLLGRTLAAIVPTDPQALAAAQARQAQLTKPAGSLGLLETTGAQLAAIHGTCPPPFPERGWATVFCGDHGVTAAGVSAWGQELTAQMAINICRGGAGINALSAQSGITVHVVDVGMATDIDGCPLPSAFEDARCDVLLRPDDVVHDDAAPVQARVLRKSFRGAEFLYTLELAGGLTVMAHVPSHHDHAVGEWIGIRPQVDHVVTFARA